MYVPNFFSFALCFMSFLSFPFLSHFSLCFCLYVSVFIPVDTAQSHQWRGVLNIRLRSRIILCQAQ